MKLQTLLIGLTVSTLLFAFIQNGRKPIPTKVKGYNFSKVQPAFLKKVVAHEER